jgi:uncharacterized membrane protein YheB (UPF0754 family)
MDNHLLALITIPLFTGAIGYLTNWSGVVMLFYPARFVGVKVPGLAGLAVYLPRKIQAIPGIIHGKLGWQGIAPSRAARMGSLAVDKGIAKLGSPAEFYKQLEPEKIAEHVLSTARGDMRDVVDRIMEREYPRLWNDLPPRMRDAVHARVQEQLPDIVRSITDEIGTHIDQLLDIKLMVIRHIEANPALVNRIFLDVGKKELRFIINMGFVMGFLLGVPLAFTLEALPYWWLLLIGGVVIGYVTNYVGLWLLFEPVERRKIGPFTMHGMFLRRQPEVAEMYSEIIAMDIVTVSNIGDELLRGPRSDRTRHMIETSLRPAVDRAVGPARSVVAAALGRRRYDSIRESVAVEGVEYTVNPFNDPEFNRRQSAAIRALIATRMREMPSTDFAEMMRTAIKEDEWMLLAHGAILGLVAGFIHLLIFGV